MPKTPEGKAISSKNSLQHGCCSRILILADESEAEFNALRDGWLADYQPDTDPALTLVLETVKAEWFLLRTQRWHDKIQAALSDNPVEWTEEELKKLDRFARYRTAAERAFHRHFNDLEHYRKTRKAGPGGVDDRLLSSAGLKPEGESDRLPSSTAPAAPPPKPEPLFTGKNAPKKQRKIEILDQWIEITMDEQGNTLTQLFPSNEDLIKEGHTMDPPPELVYRRLNFVDGVPPQYGWATSSPERRAAGGMAIQRMSVETWLETIAREQAAGTGHVGRCGKPLPRPKEHGECACPVCTRLYAASDPAA